MEEVKSNTGLSATRFYGSKFTSAQKSFKNKSQLHFKARSVKKKICDSINKNVSHKIRKPKVSKSKKIIARLRPKQIRMPSRLATNRSSRNDGKKMKIHKLASPGVSLLEQPESQPSPQKKFFTSRSTEPAVVSLSKTIKLSSVNGEISMASRLTALPKKNIGRTIENELDEQIASGILNISTIENVRFDIITDNSTSQDASPIRSAKVKQSVLTPINEKLCAISLNTLSPKHANLVKARRVSPRKSQKTNSVSKENRVNHSPKRRTSPRKLTYRNFGSPRKRSANINEGEQFSIESLEDLSAEWNDDFSKQDEILCELLADKETPIGVNRTAQSPKVIRSPRRSPRKEMKNVKYFPVFEHRTNKIENKLKKQKRGNGRRLLTTSDPNQMIIDAGQSPYGAIHCKSCDFLYEVGDPSDEKMHKEFHSGLIKALNFNGWKNERQVTNVDKHGGRILKIMMHDSSHWWRKIDDIIEMVDMDLGFVNSGSILKERSAAFLYVKKKTVCGCLLVEEIDQAFKFIQQMTGLNMGSLLCCSSVPQKAFVGVSRIWVTGFERRSGIASALMDCMRSHMYPCHYLTTEEFAFSDPTEQGMQFAKKYTKINDFLVYRRSESFPRNDLT